jgi:hypothetical protein
VLPESSARKRLWSHHFFGTSHKSKPGHENSCDKCVIAACKNRVEKTRCKFTEKLMKVKQIAENQLCVEKLNNVEGET